MKKPLIVMLALLLVLSLSACDLFGIKSNAENKQKYEQALTFIEEGNDIAAYRLLYQAKDYAPAQTKIDEMLANDYSLQYRAAEIGHTIKFGRYEQDNNLDNGDEAIEWTVLKAENNKFMLLSNKVLDCQKFYSEKHPTYTWADSYLCNWLNENFYVNSFLENEKEQIISTSIKTYEIDLSAYDTVNLKVYILSREEYFEFDYNTKVYINDFSLSEFAQEQNHKRNSGENTRLYSKHFIFRDASKYGLYYLRLERNYNSTTTPTTDYTTLAMTRYYNIRPVIWIQI